MNKKELIEPQKPVVPKFVADRIEAGNFESEGETL